MQSRDFCFWLQGFFELSETADQITADQARTIRRHLDLVFAHEGFPVMRERPIKAPEPAPSPPTKPEPVRDAPRPEPHPAPWAEPIPVRC